MKNFILTTIVRYSKLTSVCCRLLLLGFVMLVSLQASAQQRTISGTVTSVLDGTSLPGVNVVVKGTSSGTVTDVDGNYSIVVTNDSDLLVFSYVGYTSEEVPVSSISGDTYDIALAEDIEALSEVVVVGYGTVKKSDLTGSVSQVDGKRLQQLATSDPNQALQGRAPGVQIVNNSGAPAAGQRVRIRGVGSLSNSDPLYVVDGFPTGDISNIPPADIESIEVLKDASATAIYGSRGANGVVIVTTKRGEVGKTNFSFNSYYGVQEAWQQIDLLNASEYAALRLEAYENGGQTLGPSNRAKLEFVTDNNSMGTNWQRELFRQGRVQNYNLSVNGGTEKARYNVSGTYFRNDGIVKNTYLEKLFTRANIDLELTEKISGGLNVAISLADYTPFNESNFGGPLVATLQKDPLTAVIDASTGTWGRSGVSDIQNPARLIEEAKNRTNRDNRVQAGAFVKAEIIEGLSLTSQFTIDRTNGDRINYSPEFFVTNNEQRSQSVLFTENVLSSSWVNSNFLSYDRTFGEHVLNATAGIEFNYFKNNYAQITALDVPASPELWYVSASRSPDEITARDGESRYAIMSYFGRLNYSFADRYLLTGTVRWDGSSKFIGDYRWGVFPSFSAGWNLHNEAFFPDTEIITIAKLRAGWGEVGNQATVGPYAYLTLFQPNYNYTFGGALVPGSIPTTLANPDIRWETSRTTNVGADLGFLGDRLTLTADYFIRKTLDMLYPQPTPGFAGALGGTANIGDLENKGIELQLTYRGQAGDFNYSVSANATHINSTVTDLGGGEPTERGSESRAGGSTTRTEEGKAPGYFYGLVTNGIFQSEAEINNYTNAEGNLIQPNAQPGDIRYVDVNEDGAINFASDRAEIGSPLPEWTLGLSSRLAFKGFDLNVLFTGSVGNEIANMMTFYLEHPEAGFNGSNSYATRLNRWTPENPSATEPRVTSTDPNQNFLYSDRYIEDGSYVRLKNVQLGYTFGESLVERFSMSNLRIYVSSDNLFTLTDYTGFDPEIGNFNGDPLQAGVDYGAYPQARTIIAGININF